MADSLKHSFYNRLIVVGTLMVLLIVPIYLSFIGSFYWSIATMYAPRYGQATAEAYGLAMAKAALSTARLVQIL